jgi:hypothetical protein
MRRATVLWIISVLLPAAFSQRGGSNAELVVDPGANGAGKTRIHALEFTDQSTLRAIVTDGRDTSIARIGGDEDSVHFLAGILPHTAVSVVGDTLVGLAPLQVEVFDVKRERRISTLKVDSVDAWPLTCANNGLCAWQSGEAIHVEPVSGRGSSRNFFVGQDAVLSLDISPDGKLLAAGINQARVRLWNLADGQELPALPMESTTARSGLAAPFSLQGISPRLLVLSRPGMATVVRFSPDGSLLAAANETGVHLWHASSGQRDGLLSGYQGRVSAMAFSGDSRSLAVASEDKVVRLFTLSEQRKALEVCRVPTPPSFLALRADSRFLAAGFADGVVDLWNTGTKALAAHVRLLDDGWIVTVPSGRFDTSEQAWHRASWQFGGPSGLKVPFEAFYRDLYEPGLLGEVLAEKMITPGIDVATVHPELPSVSLSLAQRKPPQMELVPGQGIRATPERLRFHVEARPARPNGVVADIEVTLNGIVAKKWSGKQVLNSAGVVVQEIEMPVPPGNLRVTAYAFDENDIRSTESVWERPLQGWGYPVEQRTLYVLAIGVAAYQNPEFSLNFADSDARLVASTLGMSDGDLRQIGDRVQTWSSQRAIDTLQPTRQQEVPARTRVTVLTNAQATRAGVLGALRDLAKTAEPKDAVVIFYAGHGLSDQHHYYMLPWDMGLTGGPGDVSAETLERGRGSLISDDDIAEALADLNVRYGALILDSCFSGQALEGSELIGPSNAKGLIGWAYDKGISLLAASEGTDPSFELKKLGTSVLTHALIHDGWWQMMADQRPLDGRIELEEWLRFAPARVPLVTGEADRAGVEPAGQAVQRARFAPSHKIRSAFLVLTAAEKEP